MKKSFVCIACPRGCQLTVISSEDAEKLTVSGNRCPRGATYGKQEFLCPMRTLTTTVSCLFDGSEGSPAAFLRLPVKTGCEIPLDDIMTVVDKIHNLTVKAPIHHGDCIARIHTGGTVIPVIACASTEEC